MFQIFFSNKLIDLNLGSFLQIMIFNSKLTEQNLLIIIYIFYILDCYKSNYKKYNWLIFYDLDEYINLK